MLVTFQAPEDFQVKGLMVTVFDPASMMANNQPKFYSTPFKEKEKKPDLNQPTIDEIAVTSLQRHSGYGTLRITGSGFGDYERPPITGERELLCLLKRPSDPRISDEQTDRIHLPEVDKKNPNYTARKIGELPLNQLPPSGDELCQTALTKQPDQAVWRKAIEERVNVMLTPRNPDFRIERTQVTYIDDHVIDVYFEFSRWDNYSTPLRLDNATVTINKGAVSAASTSDETSKYAAVVSSPQTFVVRNQVGLPRDKNLEYRYTILSQKDAGYLFGDGIAENFYVIELAVVNNAQKKMAIPLGSIQAEVAWLYGQPKKGGAYFYEEGPATLPALPLGAVSGYFDAYQKSKGKWAKIFNVLDGVATLSATMVPVIRELERPGLILTTGVIPGMRKAIGDLSGEQIARLTSLSWEGVEEIPASGSKTKFIYVPRAEQLFGDFKGRRSDGTSYVSRKKVIDLTALEVVGFEVTESQKKAGTEKESGATGGEKETPKP
jgi:hypothetical protein